MLTTYQLTRICSQIRPDDLPSYTEAREYWAKLREREGFARTKPMLMARDNNTKVKKNEPLTWTLSLSPHKESGVLNTCTNATKECIYGCVSHNGNGAYPSVIQGRRVRTMLLVERPDVFAALMRRELQNVVRYGERKGRAVAVRLNTFSDLPWERMFPWLLAEFGGQFYDYTKDWKRIVRPANYHLTFSVSHRTTEEMIDDALSAGRNVAMVADRSAGNGRGECGTSWRGHRVVDGDQSDYRPGDGEGVLVHLYPKGRARSLERGGFVRSFDEFDVTCAA